MRAPANDRFERVDAVFDAALELPTTEQVAYVERTCSEDPALRDEVLALLRAHYHSGGILDTPPGALSRSFAVGETLPGPDERIGPFRIIRPIGLGGMGQVYLGIRDDDQFEQRVALKLIRHPSDAVVRRFFEERRILAWLEHPRIARLIDGGITPEGMPYFAMEYVDGEPIDRYCETRGLSLDARLALFEQVCDAVSYAHQHLVIHRDLKPGNILVTGDGQVKLLDFGIAKVLDTMGTEDETRTGMRIMTPEVAAPEQVRGEPVSTATDVYALGILLHQLIAGQRPYDVRGKSPAEFERIVCHVVPDPPSTKAPAGIARRVRGDLDLIVQTALQKNPSRRYQAPGTLALDIHRFRQGFAIGARPDTLRYRAKKFLERHRVAAMVGALVIAGLIGGVLRERSLRHQAEVAARTATEVQNFLVGVFDVADPFASTEPGTMTANAILERGAQRIDSSLGASPEVQAEMRTVLGRVYTNLGAYQKAIPLLERSLAQRRAIHGDNDTTVAASMDLLGLALLRVDRYDEAEKLLKDALALRRRLAGNVSASTALSAEHLAMLYEEQAKLAPAESLHREALAINRLAHGDSAAATANSMNNVGLVSYRRASYAQAESLYRGALAIQLASLGDRHATTAATMHNLAQALDIMGRRDSAEHYYRRSLAAKRAALGDLHPSVTIGLNNLGQFLANDRGKHEEAEALTREALDLDRRIFGERHTFVAEGLRNLGIIRRSRGDFLKADSAIRAALEMDRALIGERNLKMANLYGHLGQVRHQLGDFAEAVRLTRESLSRYEELSGDKHRNTNVVRANLARVILEGGVGRAAEAESLLNIALTHLDSAQSGSRAPYVVARRALGEAKLARGRTNEAIPILTHALEMARKDFGENNARTAPAKLSLGRALLAAGRYDQAAPLLQQADSVIQLSARAQPQLAKTSARALVQLGLSGR